MSVRPAPPFVSFSDVLPALRRQGHGVLAPASLGAVLGTNLPSLQSLTSSWDSLPADAYLRDGGRYRRRRHACCVVEGPHLLAVPHRAHWQPLEYNALHGGIERWFEPVVPATLETPAWSQLLLGLSALCTQVQGERSAHQPWFVEAHQFRIDTTDGIGRPTPEGAHRDGVDFVAVALVNRHRVKGGETRVFDANGPDGIRFTMTDAWTVLLLDDARVIHETTPIQPLDAALGYRDTLVVTWRRGGFQGPGAAV